MTDQHDDSDSTLSLAEARLVLTEIANSPEMRQEHAEVVDFCDARVLQDIVQFAWRHQFSDDRSGFKKDISTLQQYVADKAMEQGGINP
jgi:hypothetical protein